MMKHCGRDKDLAISGVLWLFFRHHLLHSSKPFQMHQVFITARLNAEWPWAHGRRRLVYPRTITVCCSARHPLQIVFITPRVMVWTQHVQGQKQISTICIFLMAEDIVFIPRVEQSDQCCQNSLCFRGWRGLGSCRIETVVVLEQRKEMCQSSFRREGVQSRSPKLFLKCSIFSVFGGCPNKVSQIQNKMFTFCRKFGFEPVCEKIGFWRMKMDSCNWPNGFGWLNVWNKRPFVCCEVSLLHLVAKSLAVFLKYLS